MPLLLLDLDNTLVDRAAAFRLWAEDFVTARALPQKEVEWLSSADRDGYERREDLAAAIRAKFGLGSPAVERLGQDLRHGMVDRMIVDPEIPPALARATDSGWTPFVITNGTVEQQQRKLRKRALHSTSPVGLFPKPPGAPSPRGASSMLAARSAGQSLDGGWMVGDSAQHDIAGAHAAGLASVWLHRGRSWEEGPLAPSIILDTCPAAIDHIIGHQAGIATKYSDQPDRQVERQNSS